MIQELISTSAPRCLSGNAGYGIVAQTTGMAPNVSRAVDALSGYTHIAAPGSGKNPVIYLHAVRQTGGMLRHIVSRIDDCGNDYTGRSNRIAHHWIIEEGDVHKLKGGPAAVLTTPGIFEDKWDKKPELLPSRPQKLSPAEKDVPKKICKKWEELTGDAGWGGVVAECAEKGNPVSIIFSPQQHSTPFPLILWILLLSEIRRYAILPFSFSHTNKEVIMKKQYKVTLTPDERSDLIQLVSTGKSSAAKIKHANILLAVDENEHGRVSDGDVAKQFHCHANTVANIRERFVEEGLESALERKKRLTPPITPIFDGRAEAQLIKIACSTPPEGRCRWTLELLADKCVELNIVSQASDTTVHRVLKKTKLSLTSRNAT